MFERLTAIPPAFITSDGERLSKSAYAFLILLCLTFFLPGFTTLPPTDRDESLFAQASKQMIESGNYVDINYQNEPRYKKPVGIYWLQAASVKLFSPNDLNEIWAYRIPSLFGAIVAVIMTAALGTLLFSPIAGFLGAIMMAGCFILNVEARMAKTDAALLGATMVAQYALARAYIGYGNAKIGWGVFFAFWTALGIGILLKGPIILLMLFSTLFWLLATERNLRWFRSLKPMLGIAWLLVLVAPWFLTIIAASKGQFLQQSAGRDLFAKLWEGQNRGFLPFGVYCLVFPFTFFPFALWALMAIPDSWKNRKEPAVRFCLGWIIPSWVVFEFAFTKLPHYVMPLYPAMALLAAKALLDGYPKLQETKRVRRWLPTLATIIWLVTGIGFIVFACTIPYNFTLTWNPGIVAASLLVAIGMGVTLLALHQQQSGIIVMAAASLVFITSLFVATLPNVKQLWLSREIVNTAESAKPCEGQLQLLSNFNEPSLVFLGGTNTRLINGGQEIAQALKQNSCAIAAVTKPNEQDFLDAFKVADAQPSSISSISGLDAGRGRFVSVNLYLLSSRPSP